MKMIRFIYQILFPYIFILMSAILLALGADIEEERIGIFIITLLSILLSISGLHERWQETDHNILKKIMIVKLAHTPVYIITFVMGLMGIPLLAVAGLGIFYIALAFLLDVFFIINSGIYATVGITRTRQRHKILLCVLSFLFVVDVVVSIWMYVKNGKGDRSI